MGNLHNRIKVGFSLKEDKENNSKQQSKLQFNRIHGFYTNYDTYTFKQNAVLMDEPNNSGFAILELSEISMYETY